MGSKQGQITGYSYSMSIHMGLCRGPIDAIVNIKVDTKQLTYTPGRLTDGANIYINDPYLFGGPQAEGGIVGGFQTYFGTATQNLSDFMISLMKEPLPSFRGLTTVWFNGEVAANNPYLKAWIFRVQRTVNGWARGNAVWYPEKAAVRIAAILVEFYNTPVQGETITFNNNGVINTITYVAEYGTPVGPQLAPQQSTVLDAQVFCNYVNANQDTLGLFATTGANASDTVVTLTLINTSPDAPKYTVTCSGTNFNPRISNPLLQGDNTIVAMNPAHMLYEICTNPIWGRGLPVAMMDDGAFRKAADQLYVEGFGLCMTFDQRGSLSEFIRTIVEHIGAAIYISRLTGLMTMRLLRADYDSAAIPFFDKNSGLISVENDGSSAQPTSFNEVIVTYHDPLQNIDLEMRAQNLASWKANQSILSQTKSYPGIATPALAARVSLRDLQQQAVGLKRFVLKFDQSARFLQPGDVFAFRDLTRGISFMVMRIGQANFGTPKDKTITLTCLQDVFDLPATGYQAIPVSGWTKPNNVPAVATQRSLQEASYRDLSHYLSGANLAAFPATSGAITMLAANPGIVSGAYQLATAIDPATPAPTGANPWAPAATLVGALDLAATTFDVINFSANGVAPPTPFAMLVGNEWMRCDAYDPVANAATVARGCVDTVPVAHVDGENVFFADYFEGSDYVEYVSGETIDVQVLAITGQGILSQSVAPTDQVTIQARQFRPYPPGQVMVAIGSGAAQSFSAGPFTPAGSDVTFTWASRNRVLQADALIDQSESSVTPETGTTYNVNVINNGTVRRTVTGLTALTWTYTAAEQVADAITGVSYVLLESERDGVVSWTHYSIQLNVPPLGYGSGYGTSYGIT